MKFDPNAIIPIVLPYNVDEKEKILEAEVVGDDGAKTKFQIPIISGKKGIEHTVIDQWPAFDLYAKNKKMKGGKRFKSYVLFLTGEAKEAFCQVTSERYPDAKKRTIKKFRKCRRKMVRDLTNYRFPGDKQLEYYQHLKYEDFQELLSPREFIGRLKSTRIAAKKGLIFSVKKPDEKQFNKWAIEMFPKKPYQRYLKDQGIEYSSVTVTLNDIGRNLAICYDRLKEDDEMPDGQETKRKSKGNETSSSTKKLKSGEKWEKPKSTDTCPLHGGHLWGECTDNPWCSAYIPRAPYQERVKSKGRPNPSRRPSNQSGRPNTQQGGYDHTLTHHLARTTTWGTPAKKSYARKSSSSKKKSVKKPPKTQRQTPT